MTNYSIGKDVIASFDIQPFELFKYVLKGLQPFNNIGKPEPTPPIAIKINKLRVLKQEAEFLLKDVRLRMTPEERTAHTTMRLAGCKKNPYGNGHEAYCVILDHNDVMHKVEKLEHTNKEINDIEDFLDRLDNKYTWVGYELPDDKREAQNIINYLTNCFYNISELKDYFQSKEEILRSESVLTSASSAEERPVQANKEDGRTPHSLTRRDDIWYIFFEGQERTIKHRVGFQYIAYLIKNPEKDISCVELVHAVNVPTSTFMGADRAIAEDLNISTGSVLIGRHGASQTLNNLWSEYKELHEEIDIVESEYERLEIEKRINEILAAIREEKSHNVDPIHKKAQSAVSKGIKGAIQLLRERGMEALAAYLDNNIKPNGKYGYEYTGEPWEIILK